jgi:ATP-dependent protease ClpP protease subunit
MLPQPGLRNVNLQKAKLFHRLENHHGALATELRNVKLDWYTMRNVAGDDDVPADVFVYDEIGGSFGVAAKDFIDELNEISASQIVVRINSPGGSVVDAIAIASALAQHPAEIITRVDGIAASAASIIAVAGDRCEMMIGSQMMVHDAMCSVTANAKEMREAAEWLDNQSRNVAEIYAKKSKGDPEEWRKKMLAETWMFADESVAFGLADAVYERSKDFGIKDAEPEPEDEPEEESTEDDGETVEAEDENEALNALMHRQHRLTNRGYRYLGRNRAPAPAVTTNNFADLLKNWG